MRTTESSGALASVFLLAIGGVLAIAPGEAWAQSTSMTGFQFEQRLDRVRSDAARLERIVTEGWKSASKKKKDRYRNGLHEQLDELQKQARTEKRKLQSPSSGMFSTERERRLDYRDLEYTVQRMEEQLRMLEQQVNRMQESRESGD